MQSADISRAGRVACRRFRSMSQGHVLWLAVLPALMLSSGVSHAQAGLPALIIDGTEDGGQTWSLSLQALALMTMLTLLPAILLLMTSFTRITIVLGILRTAMGTPTTPSNQVMIGLALFLTLFVMRPVFTEIHEDAVKPFMAEQISAEAAIAAAAVPFRKFMLQ